MTDTPNPAPAGAGDAPMGNADTSILDRMWEGDPGMPEDAEAEAVADEPEQGKEEPQPSETDEPKPEGEGEEEIAEAGEEEEPADDAAEAEPKDKPDDDEETGSRMHRLRDGTSVSLGDLKRGYDEARQFRAALPQIQQERQRFQQEREQFTAQQQQFQNQLPIVTKFLESKLPPVPNPELMNQMGSKYDPIQYMQDKFAYDAAISELRQVSSAHQAEVDEQRNRAAAEVKSSVQNARQRFVQGVPAMQAPGKAQEFFTTSVPRALKALGYTEADAETIQDPRLLVALQIVDNHLSGLAKQQTAQTAQTQKKAIATQKVAKAPPVQAPAARQSAGVRAGQVARSDLERLKKTGSVTDAEAFLSRFE